MSKTIIWMSICLLSISCLFGCSQTQKGPEAQNSDLGVDYLKSGDYSKAIQFYKKAIRLNPDDANARCGLGVAYGESGDFQQAIASFKEAIRVKSDYAEAYCYLGAVYAKSGENQKAIASLKKAIRIKPNNAEAHCGLGLLYLALNDHESALDEYQILKDLDQELANKLFNAINK